MTKYPVLAALAVMAGLLLGALPASAHPHVWVTMRSEVVYAPDGKVTGIRHAWTFDDMFSAFAIQGIETETPKAAPKVDSKSQPQSQGFLGWLRSTWTWLTGRSEPKMGEPKAKETKEAKAGEEKKAVPAPTGGSRDPTREQLHPLAQTNVESLKDFEYFTLAKANGKRVDFVDPPNDYYLDYRDQVLTLHFTLPLKEPVAAQNLEFAIYDASYFVDFSFEKANAVRLVDAPKACQLLVARPEELDAETQAKLFQMAPDQKLDPSQQLGEQFANRILVKCP